MNPQLDENQGLLQLQLHHNLWAFVQLIESGEKERLMELLRERLIECGWKDEMKALCRQFVKKKGSNNVTVDDLIHVITPRGRASIPDSIKAELLQRIRTFLVSAAP
ncbi:hypothetical protein L484_010767 [Morus notabilis]|uniref:Transcription and mRNA export factor ENY2 n=1 Tax=Morus notabilis TaxID=981085 RepID=W9SAL2_9ROSA|nr:hypothetical protein L484_010767 [Morus notabilis]